MSKKIILSDFRVLRPKYTGTYLECVEWLAAVHAKAESVQQGSDFDTPAFQRSMERHIRRFGPNAETMATRGYDLEDFLHRDWDKMRLFNLNKNPHGAGMAARMEVFAEITDRALEYFYPEVEQNPPSDIIHVSCTGYVAPSAPQKLIVKREWQKDIGIIHAYHMGCYASMPAIRIASAFLNSQQKHIDIVHTECCGLHLDPSQHSPEQLVVQSLFSDGHIRYSLSESSSSSPSAASASSESSTATNDSTPSKFSKGLEFLGMHEEIVPGSLDSIGWVLGDFGMRIILARDVPELISKVLRNFVASLFLKNNIDPSEAYTNGIFAVHPGGPRIIDKVAELLELAPEQVAASRAILKAYGNMSSATLPHIWANIVEDENIPPGKLITSLAFGPGLTIYGAIFRKC